jgi:serine/threonine protein phosphatase PrpC
MAWFKRLFGEKKKRVDDVKTAPLSEEQLKSVTKSGIKYEPTQLIVGCGQSVGKQREHNEDALYFMNSVLAENGGEIPFGIYIIADGMGGHQHGEIASGVAARVLANHLVRNLYLPNLNITPEKPGDPLLEIMKAGVQEVQQAVVKFAPGGGTTLTAALVVGEQVTLAHVGDSRAYFIYPDGRMDAITRDHSLVKRLQELGQITEREAMVHPQRNVLYRAIGQGEPFDADINTYQLPHPGYLLICTDGLWGVVPEDEILRTVTSASDPALACQKLVEAANNAGGPDNISVILVYSAN